MRFSALLSLSVLLLLLSSACGSDDPPVVATVNTALAYGTLIEEDGCLRITGSSGTGGTGIVWQKDVLEVERRGDTVRIFAGDRQLVTWRLGDEIRGGGRGADAQLADEHAGTGFSERCPGPYWLLGSVDDPVE